MKKIPRRVAVDLLWYGFNTQGTTTVPQLRALLVIGVRMSGVLDDLSLIYLFGNLSFPGLGLPGGNLLVRVFKYGAFCHFYSTCTSQSTPTPMQCTGKVDIPLDVASWCPRSVAPTPRERGEHPNNRAPEYSNTLA